MCEKGVVRRHFKGVCGKRVVRRSFKRGSVWGCNSDIVASLEGGGSGSYIFITERGGGLERKD